MVYELGGEQLISKTKFEPLRVPSTEESLSTDKNAETMHRAIFNGQSSIKMDGTRTLLGAQKLRTMGISF